MPRRDGGGHGFRIPDFTDMHMVDWAVLLVWPGKKPELDLWVG